MNETKLKNLIQQLKTVVTELESEIYSDTQNYLTDLNYDDVLEYYQSPSSAEEGL